MSNLRVTALKRLGATPEILEVIRRDLGTIDQGRGYNYAYNATTIKKAKALLRGEPVEVHDFRRVRTVTLGDNGLVMSIYGRGFLGYRD